MRTLTVVPIKSLPDAKRRLARALASGARQSIVQAMFADVLGALRRTRSVDTVVVVTADVAAESIARGDGALVLADVCCSGQSDATRIGIEYALREGFDRVLLVPGDTPLLDPRELEQLLEQSERDGLEVGIVPDRHGSGTNALVLVPPDVFQPSFGPDSLKRHVDAAKSGQRAYGILDVPSLAHDVDTPADLSELWMLLEGSRRLAQRTRGALHQLDRSGAAAGLLPPHEGADVAVEV